MSESSAELEPASFGSGRYRIEARLGEGGMGVVYKAYDVELDTHVALKTLRRLTASALYRFKREFRSLADISHRNLVSLHELVSDGDQWFFTMELIDGVDFLTFVKGDEARLRAAMRELFEGVAELHRHGRFHRDIKPSNVLVTAEGRVVLLDFGLVTMLAEESADPEAMTQQVVGTVSYMAPEQAAGLPVTAASDWYSVGVILFEALTGERPFSGKPHEVLLAKQTSLPPRAMSKAPAVPEDLDALAADLLQRNPRKRPEAEEISKRLGLGSMAHVPAVPERSLFGRERHLRALADAYAESKKGRAVTVFVRGRSGMGKSALVRRFLDRLLETESPLVFSGRCYERESVPFKAFDSVIDALARHLFRLPREEVEALSSEETLHLARMFPVLLRVKSLRERFENGKRDWLRLDPHEHRRRAFLALRGLFASLAQKRPLVVFVDDIQWGDADSAHLVAELLRPPRPPPFLLIACHRSDDVETSAPLRAFLSAAKAPPRDAREIGIEPFSEEEARSLLEAESDLDRLDRSAIVAEADGNPLVIDELVRHARRRTARPARLTYEDALGSAIARLDARARHLLQLVAVSGRPVLQRVALRAAEGAGDSQAALVALLTERLLRTRILGEAEALEVYHDRIREAVVAGLEATELIERHRVLARALEAQAEPDHEALVEHLGAIGEVDRAADHAAKAGDRAASALAFDRAADLYRIALAGKKLSEEERIDLWTRLGDALADAGRGPESAAAYLEAVKIRPSRELSRRAAEQLLRSGHVDEGLEVLKSVVAKLGMSLAPTPRRAVASLLLRRAQVRLRGLRFEPKDAQVLSGEALERIDVLWSMSMGLAMVETARGADFQARHLLLALNAGEPNRVARAIAMEAAYSATGGGKTRARTEALIAKAESLGRSLDHPHALGLARYAAGVAAFLSGRFEEARRSAREAEAIFLERCTGVAWELASARVFHLWSVGVLGELVELRSLIDRYLAEAEARGDRYAAANYRTGLANLAWLAADDPQGARRQIDEVVGSWSQRGFHIQHYYQLTSETGLDLYLGHGEDAYRRMRARWPDLERSLLLNVQFIRIDALATRARTALAAATGGAKASEAALAEAERDASRILKEKMPWSDPIAQKLLAGVAARRDQHQRAASLYAEAAAGFEKAGMMLYAAVARLRAGALICGARGRGMTSDVEKWMASQGVRAPDRLAAVIAP